MNVIGLQMNEQRVRVLQFVLLWCLVFAVGFATGCRSLHPSADSLRPNLLHRLGLPFPSAERRLPSLYAELTSDASDPLGNSKLTVALESLRLAEETERALDPECLAHYAKAAMESLPVLQANAEGQSREEEPAAMAWEIYQRSLSRLTANAIKFDRFDPQRGIALITKGGDEAWIEVVHSGFPWTSKDFAKAYTVPEGEHNRLRRYWETPGIGVPLVIQKTDADAYPFMGPVVPFAATAILRPVMKKSKPTVMSISDRTDRKRPALDGEASSELANSEPPTVGVLELHNPVCTEQVAVEDQTWQLAKDVSAPLALAQVGLDRDNYLDFLMPGREDESLGLRMIEPYQPGKIPIVFVHGLLSDRITWVELANDLRAIPWFNRRYQIWSFQYVTGEPFVRSAAAMRTALRDAVSYCDPEQSDPALSEMVLVGHSMGGLVSKLQITSSGEALWDSIANRPIDEIDLTMNQRELIDRLFHFEPLPFVKRVVFIGSPHQGSPFATSWVGRVGSQLVIQPHDRTVMLHAVMKQNPGLFDGQLTKHLPTSVDLLRPDNAILAATYELPVHRVVRVHTIIGNGKPLKDGTPADGVVSVASARHPGAASEKIIDTIHTELTHHPETTAELVRILSRHTSD
ncbi:MAG: esterase/lipase family protein [Rubripirellula sp.]